MAGDIVAAEDRHATLKTILTRSVERQQVFAAKALAAFSYAVLAIVVTGTVALVAGILASGFHSIVSPLRNPGLGHRPGSDWSGQPRAST